MAQQTGGCCVSFGVKFITVVLALGLSVYMLGPPLYWHLMENGAAVVSDVKLACHPCICDCTSTSDLATTPIADCSKDNPDLREELGKSQVQLLKEELKLQQEVNAESEKRAELSFLEAKKIASQYQKEAEKCNTGMETSEEAREKAEAALVVERKQTTVWERRARSMGWKDKDQGRKEDNDRITADGDGKELIESVNVQDLGVGMLWQDCRHAV